MLLDSNILIYGASGGFPALDEILDRTDLAVASVTRIETLGYHQLSGIEHHWLEAAFASMCILPLDDAVAGIPGRREDSEFPPYLLGEPTFSESSLRPQVLACDRDHASRNPSI